MTSVRSGLACRRKRASSIVMPARPVDVRNAWRTPNRSPDVITKACDNVAG